MQNHKIEANSELMYENGSIFYQNYRHQYTVIPITTFRGAMTKSALHNVLH